jgi:hypothetical protein
MADPDDADCGLLNAVEKKKGRIGDPPLAVGRALYGRSGEGVFQQKPSGSDRVSCGSVCELQIESTVMVIDARQILPSAFRPNDR